MKIVIAPDSYKGALRSPSVASALAAGWRQRRPDDQLIEIPLADGGEGTAEALCIATGGRRISKSAHDALMRPLSSEYILLGDGRAAALEMAAASGIELLKTSELDPLTATTYGSGELLLSALQETAPEIFLGIGGSATVDGGAGFLQALGVKFYDRSGRLLPNGIGGGGLELVDRIDASELKKLPRRKIVVACDVTNPLLGATGAAAVFGPQKGATELTVPVLERNLRHWFEVVRQAGFASSCDAPGDGAAGGLGFALRTVLGAEICSGAGLVIRLSGLPEALHDADLLITGEGCSDDQTACGKLCAVAAETAKAAGVPAVLCSGALRGDTGNLERLFAAVFSIASGPGTLELAIRNTGENLRRAGANFAGICSAFSRKRG